ncbi:MAG: hypothetical protein HY825_18835 [Acidobacteria bacterium]|nr:hypothetical protein [Acidobacteriota bacterium]
MAADANTNHRAVLRNEALPFDLAELTDSQARVLRDILAAIADASQAPDEMRRNWGRDAGGLGEQEILLDKNRRTRLLFLSGGRGSGKTSVMLSLAQLLHRQNHPTQVCAERIGVPQERPGILRDRPGSRKQVEEAVVRLAAPLAQHTVWLETLDLEPLPKPTNLLAAVWLRIEQGLEQRGLRDDIKALSYEISTLKHDIAVAWEGNLPQRSPNLDPDAYVVEMFRSEESRTHFPFRLRKLVDQLAEKARRKGFNPVFLLPVDDFDLNPLRATELLHLLRMVSIPRLFVLVMGDARVTELVTALRKSGDFNEVIQYARIPECLALPGEEIGGTVRSIAAHAMRKLLPPAQRIALEDMTIDEALRYQPRAQDVSTLGQLLAKVPVEVETAVQLPAARDRGVPKEWRLAGSTIQGLANFLDFGPWDGWSDALPRDEFSRRVANPYTGAIVLRSSPRHVADLWFSLDRVAHKKPGDPADLRHRPGWDPRLSDLVETLGEETRRAVQEDPLLWIQERERLLEIVQLGPGDEWLQDADASKIGSFSTWRDGRLPVVRDEMGVCTLRAAFFGDWLLRLDPQPSGSDAPHDGKALTREELRVSDRTRALIVLLHDLLALKQAGGLVGPHPLAPDPNRLGWAVARWHIDVPGADRFAEFHWPTPPWTSFWEFELLADAWRRGINLAARTADQKSGLKPFVDDAAETSWLAAVWIAAITSIIGDATGLKDCLPLTPKKPRDASEYSKDLSGSAAKIFGKLNGKNPPLAAPRRRLIEGWQRALMVMLAPEYNLPQHMSEGLLDSIDAECLGRKAGDDDKLCQEVRRRREAAISQLVEMGDAGIEQAIRFGAVPVDRLRDQVNGLLPLLNAIRVAGAEESATAAVQEVHEIYSYLEQVEEFLEGRLSSAEKRANSTLEALLVHARTLKETISEAAQAAALAYNHGPVGSLVGTLELIVNASKDPYNKFKDGWLRPILRTKPGRMAGAVLPGWGHGTLLGEVHQAPASPTIKSKRKAKG